MERINMNLKQIYRYFFGKYRLSSLISSQIDYSVDVSLLDIGCGRNSPVRELDQKEKVFAVGLDFYEPYIQISKSLSIHNDYILDDLRNLGKIASNSFDYVISTEVLEHLKKDAGRELISQMERIARKKIMLTTPNGFLPTYAGPDDNPDETHVCGWNVDELRKLGFIVHGLHGLKMLWKVKDGQASSRFRPERMAFMLIDISELLAYDFPASAFQLFFVKNVCKS
jgi:2-polyprenyl-3-methyl-5-hydroxy-6-metoxy-1,4-benzoquinol methylase